LYLKKTNTLFKRKEYCQKIVKKERRKEPDIELTSGEIKKEETRLYYNLIIVWEFFVLSDSLSRRTTQKKSNKSIIVIIAHNK